jgi:hypothetical protein
MSRVRLRRLLAPALLGGSAWLACGVDLAGEAVPDAGADARPDPVVLPDGSDRVPDPPDVGASDAGADADADGADVEPLAVPDATPGEVACRNGPCAPPNFCCVDRGRCDGNPSACGTNMEVRCDDPGDCSGLSCCLGANVIDGTRPSSYCEVACTEGRVKICQTSFDCVLEPCVGVRCLGRTFGVCGGKVPPACGDGTIP